MARDSAPRFVRGDAISVSRLNRVAEMAARALDVQGPNLSVGSDGIRLRPALPEKFLAEITGNTGAAPVKHSWRAIVERVDGTLSDAEPVFRGTTAVQYAIAPGGIALETGTLIHLRKGFGEWYEAIDILPVSDPCRNFPRLLSSIAGWNAGIPQILAHTADGCLEWLDWQLQTLDVLVQACLTSASTQPGAVPTLTNQLLSLRVPTTWIGDVHCQEGTDCCPCTDAPPVVRVALTSGCGDLDDVEVALTYDDEEDAWLGSVTTAASVVLAIRLDYSAARGWWVQVTYAGALIASTSATVQWCAPFHATFSFAACFVCGGGAGIPVSYAVSATVTPIDGAPGDPTEGGVLVPGGCCANGTIYSRLCLESALIDGDCPDLDGIVTQLLFDANRGSWDSVDAFPYCVSPFHDGCSALDVHFRIACINGSEDSWGLYLVRPGYDCANGYLCQQLTTFSGAGLCAATPVTVDVAVDSTGATFPPGVDDACCVATIRFTISTGACAGGGGGDPVDTECCADVPPELALAFSEPAEGLPTTLEYAGFFGAGGWEWREPGVEWFEGQWRLRCYYDAAEGDYVWHLYRIANSYFATAVSCAPLELTFEVPREDGGGTFTIVPA